jgi:hypothetical protein
MNVHAGDGNDSLFIQLPIAQHVYMNTGAGNDAVSVTETTAKSATIDTGTGNDAVEVRFSSFDRVHAWLGTGDDQIAAQNVLVRLSVLLDGGLGFDQLSDDGGNVLNNATILNF